MALQQALLVTGTEEVEPVPLAFSQIAGDCDDEEGLEDEYDEEGEFQAGQATVVDHDDEDEDEDEDEEVDQPV